MRTFRQVPVALAHGNHLVSGVAIFCNLCQLSLTDLVFITLHKQSSLGTHNSAIKREGAHVLSAVWLLAELGMLLFRRCIPSIAGRHQTVLGILLCVCLFSWTPEP